MKNLLFIFVICFNWNFYSQEIKIDTIQTYKNKNLFHLIVTKIGFNYEVKFTNVSKKNIYIVESSIFNASNNENEFIIIGNSTNGLSDGKYYFPDILKIDKTLISELSPNSMSKSIVLEITIYLNKIGKNKQNEYQIEKWKYLSKQKTFKYLIPIYN